MDRCKRFQPLLALRPADLRLEEQQSVQRHVVTCADCAMLSRRYAEQNRLISNAPHVHLTPSQRSHLFSQIQNERRQQTMITKLSLVVSGVIAIVVFILIGLGTRSLMNFDPSDSEMLSAQPSGGEEAPMRVPETTPSVEVTATPVVASTLAWPVNGHITQSYSEKHLALDIAAPIGAPVRAGGAGVVATVERDDDGRGYTVVIDHDNGLQTRYTQLSGYRVAVGDSVVAEQRIGSVGLTRNSTGPHLHFEVIQDVEKINPLVLLADEPYFPEVFLIWPVQREFIPFTKHSGIYQQEVNAVLVDQQMKLLKFEVDQNVSWLKFIFYWQPLIQIDKDYTAFLMVRNAVGEETTQMAPLGGNNGDYDPARNWQVGSTVKHEISMDLKHLDLFNRQGQYELALGISLFTEDPLPMESMEDTLVLGSFEVRMPRITQSYSPDHPALDIAAREGTAVVAATIGTIISVGWNEVDGHNVIIEHENGLQTRYTHLLDSSVEPDELVAKGQVIGRVGSTGKSTGPHLHFELIQDGERLNPLPFLE
ncbi:peptidoglycan DD-metalloendopeptidase family protein [Chloroflexota bacterium]